MDFSSSVQFWFGFENNHGFSSVLKKKQSVWFGFLCRSIVKYKKTCKLESSVTWPVLYSIIAWCRLIIWFHDHLLSDSVRNVKNVKALWERLKYWLFVWDNKFGFEKSHGNWNYGFDLSASVRFLSRISILLLTRDTDIVILSVRPSVRPSFRDTLVLYENGLTYRHSFSTVR